MPYVGGSLEVLFDSVPQEMTLVAERQMAARAGSRMEKLAKDNTPVETGKLRESWYQLPVNKTKYAIWSAYEAKVATNVEYAPYVEYGTGLWGPEHKAYTIRPRFGGMLSWIDPHTGHRVYAHEVKHPGSPGNHMLAIASEVLEFEVQHGTIFEDILSEWKRDIEAQAEARGKVMV